MSPGFLRRSLVRESRGARARLLFFALCLAVGVAAVTAVAGLRSGIEAGVRARSREILGADLAVESKRPLPGELATLLGAVPGVERTDLREMPAMAAAPGEDGAPRGTRLCRVRAVEGRFPLHGTLDVDPPGGVEALGPGDAVAAAELLQALGLGPGDALLVGGARFRVAGVLRSEPGRLGFSSLLGPRVYLAAEGLARTEILGTGNRVEHRALFRLPGDPPRAELERWKARLEAELPGAAYLDVETHHDAEPAVARQLDRLSSTVSLTALLSLLLGGVGVAQVVGAWIEGRAAAVAVLRCLGMRPSEVLLLHLAHAGLLGLAGSLLGAAAGSAVPFAVAAAAPDLLPYGALDPFRPGALLRGVGLGVGVSLLFALVPLTGLWKVPPSRALRADAEPLPPPRGVRAAAAALLGAGVFLAAWSEGGRADRAAAFAGGLAALAALLWLGARGLVRLSARIPRDRLPAALRRPVAALARPGAGTVGAVTALGIGTLVVAGMWLVETRLLEGLRASIPAEAPTVFLVDIPGDRRDGVRRTLEEGGARAVDMVPVVMARLASVDGTPVEDLAAAAGGGDRRRWVLTREQRLTWRADLPADNRIVDGALWSDPATAECSLEERFAADLGARPGTRLVFDVQGVAVPLLVTSVRSVEWTSFAINFFVVAEPGSLDGAPAFHLANARVDDAAAEARIQDRLAAAFPGVTMIRVRPVLEQVLGAMRAVALGIRVLGSFTVVAGLAILAGAVAAGAARRAREAALLKSLGATRGGVAAGFALEFALAGLVAGAVGAGGAAVLAWAFLGRVADIVVTIPFAVVPLGAAGTALLAAASGLVACLPALRAPPVETLRG